jgi:hypothetical protein
MPKFRILVNGSNFAMLHEVKGEADHPIRMGFYTNRYIETQGQELSPFQLNAMFQEIKSKLYTVNDPEDPPEVRVEEIWLVDEAEPEVDDGGQGYYLYPEDKDAHLKWVMATYRVANKPHLGKRYRVLQTDWESPPDDPSSTETSH